ncbi:MAG: hypothetical protein ABI557_20840 [Aureliella sp.]
MILAEGDEVARVDIAASDWQGPSDAAIGWWRNKMPSAAARKMRPAPNAVLLDTLSDLLERPGKSELAYLLALLLVRRRVLHEHQDFLRDDVDARGSQPSIDGTNAQQEGSLKDSISELPWMLICPVDGREWSVPATAPSTESLQALQAELQTLLFTDQ